jgi:hypothetical protein
MVLLSLLSRKRWRAGCVTNIPSCPSEERKAVSSGNPQGTGGGPPWLKWCTYFWSRGTGDTWDSWKKDLSHSLHVLLTLWVLLAKTCGSCRPHVKKDQPCAPPPGIMSGRDLCTSLSHSSACDLLPKLYWNSGFETEMFICTFPLPCLVWHLGQLFCHLFSMSQIDFGTLEAQQVFWQQAFLQVSESSHSDPVA